MVEVPIGAADYEELDRIVQRIIDIIDWGVYPRATRYHSRCGDCCYGNICPEGFS